MNIPKEVEEAIKKRAEAEFPILIMRRDKNRAILTPWKLTIIMPRDVLPSSPAHASSTYSGYRIKIIAVTSMMKAFSMVPDMKEERLIKITRSGMSTPNDSTNNKRYEQNPQQN